MTDVEKVELKRDMQKIADHYGWIHQLDKCTEELGELEEAINLHIDSGCNGNETGINEEIADVEIMTTQLKMLLHSENEVNKFKRFKVDRQLKRIASEKVTL